MNTKAINHTRLITYDSWVWVEIQDNNLDSEKKHNTWSLAQVKHPSIYPGWVLVECRSEHQSSILKTEKNNIKTPTSQRIVVPRSAVFSYHAPLATANTTYLNLIRSSADNVVTETSGLGYDLLNDVSYLYPSSPISLASFIYQRSCQKKYFTSAGPQLLIALDSVLALSESNSSSGRTIDNPLELSTHPLASAQAAVSRLAIAPWQAIVLVGLPGSGRGIMASRILSFLASNESLTTVSSHYSGDTTGDQYLHPSAQNKNIFASRIKAATCLILAMTQRSHSPTASTSFAGIIYRLGFQIENDIKQFVKARISIWGMDVSSLSTKTRRPMECLPHIFYYLLISIVALEEKRPNVSLFVKPFDALAVLKYLPKPINDEKRFHIRHFRQVIQAFVNLGFIESEISEVLQAIFVVALTDAAYTSILRHRTDELGESLTLGSIPASLASFLGVPDMTLDLQELIDDQPDVLRHLSVCIFERLVDNVISRINHALSATDVPHMPENFKNQQLEKKKKTQWRDNPTLTIIYGPGSVDSTSTISDLLTNTTDDFLLNWFAMDVLEKTKAKYLTEGLPENEIDKIMSLKDDNSLMQLLTNPELGLFRLLDMQHLELKIAESLWRKQQLRPKVRVVGKYSGADPLSTISEPGEQSTIENPYSFRYAKKSSLNFMSVLRQSVKNLNPTGSAITIHQREQFTVHHIAKPSSYTSLDFAGDNAMARIHPTLYKCVKRSHFSLFSELLGKISPSVSGLSSPTSMGHTSWELSFIRFSTRSSRLKQTVDLLTSILQCSSPCHYIFCLTTTHSESIEKQTHSFDTPFYDEDSSTTINHLALQLQQYHLADYCRLLQELFPVHIKFSEFVNSYLVILLLEANVPYSFVFIVQRDKYKARACKTLIRCFDIPSNDFRLGSESVLLTRTAALVLEARRHKLITHYLPAIYCLQRHWRLFTPKLMVAKRRRQVISLQSHIRRVLDRYRYRQHEHRLDLLFGTVMLLQTFDTEIEYDPFDDIVKQEKRMREQEVDAYRTVASIQIQSWWRCIRAGRLAEHYRLKKAQQFAIDNLQNICRRFIAQAQLLQQLTFDKLYTQKAILIQKNIRGWSRRKRFLNLSLLRVAILPIKRISLRIIGLKHRVHMLQLLSHNSFHRDMIRMNRSLTHDVLFIQKVWRGHFVRSQYRIILKAASVCQFFSHTYIHHNRYQTILQRIIFIQRWWCAYYQFKHYAPLFTSYLSLSKQHNKPVHSSNPFLSNILHYHQREYTAFHLLYFPCVFYQAFFQSSKLVDQKNLCVIPYHFQMSRSYTIDVYPQTWSWPFLQLLRHCACDSFSLQSLVNTKFKHLSWNTLETRATSLLHQSIGKPTQNDFSVLSSHAVFSALTQFPILLTIKQITIGGHHTFVLLYNYQLKQSQFHQDIQFHLQHEDTKGKFVPIIYGWGWNDKGQLGNPMYSKQHHFQTKNQIQLNILQFKDRIYIKKTDNQTGHIITELCRSIDYTSQICWIGAGEDHTLALTKEGYIFSWGDNSKGQCGHGPKYRCIHEPQIIEGLRSLRNIKLAVGAYHNLSLSVSGDVYIWGSYTDIGLETLPPQSHIYYPLKVPLTYPNGDPEPCIDIHCGRGFNIALSTDPYCLKLWGRNNCGQLGNGQLTIQSTTFPTNLLLSDIPKNPKAFLRVTSVSCGYNFVAACVSPSKGRLFLWGAFEIIDPPDKLSASIPTHQSISMTRTSTSAQTNPFLTMTKRSSNITPVSHKTIPTDIKHDMKKKQTIQTYPTIRAIREPTVVTHSLWDTHTIIQVKCGYTSYVTVMLENHDVYGFTCVQPQWFRKDPPIPEFDGDLLNEELEKDEKVLKLKAFTGLIKTTFQHPVDTVIKKTKRQLYGYLYQPLRGLFHLEPSLFQYRFIRSNHTTIERIDMSFNTKGLQLQYMTSNFKSPLFIRPQSIPSIITDQQMIIPLSLMTPDAKPEQTRSSIHMKEQLMKGGPTQNIQKDIQKQPKIKNPYTARPAGHSYLSKQPKDSPPIIKKQQETVAILPKKDSLIKKQHTESISRIKQKKEDIVQTPIIIISLPDAVLACLSTRQIHRGITLCEGLIGIHEQYQQHRHQLKHLK